jgi:hypothetical protein
MEGTDHALTTWRKSTYSGGGGGNCVEVGGDPSEVLVRDTQDRDGAVLEVGRREWRRFTAAMKATI